MGLSFFDFSNFYKLRREDLISRTNFAESLTYLVPLVYFKFKSFADLEVVSFVRFQYILHDSGVLFSESSNFYKLKRGGSNFWREPILKKVWMIRYPLLDFNFKSFKDENTLSIITFQCILPRFRSIFLRLLKFLQIKERDLFSWKNQFCRTSELFCPSFCISLLKDLSTQIFCHSLDFNVFCFIQEHLSTTF